MTADNEIVTQDVRHGPRADGAPRQVHALVGADRQPPDRHRPADLTTRHEPRRRAPLGDLIADSQLAATRRAAGGAVIAFMNPGGVRARLRRAATVTYGEAFTVQPFGNTLVTMTLTGDQIDAVLEQQCHAQGTSPQGPAGVRASRTRGAGAPVGSRVDPAPRSRSTARRRPGDDLPGHGQQLPGRRR